MVNNFARTLALLRREKGVSQRSAARELGVSQALLSHYETGAREPGLPFVVKVCDYYQVTADFLLGRSLLRDGHVIDAEQLPNALDERGNALKGGFSAAALMGKKMVLNAVALLYDIAGQSGKTAVVTEMTNFFGGAVYRLYRHLYVVSGKDAALAFSVPEAAYASMAAGDMSQCEGRMLAALHNKNGGAQMPEISGEALTAQYPQLARSMLTLVHQAGERCEKRL